jgi:predicted DNA-binding transcriptional regulator AlpA
MTREELPEFLSTTQVAKFLNCSTEFVKVARKRGTGPKFTRLGPDLIRYPREALLQWIDANTVEVA